MFLVSLFTAAAGIMTAAVYWIAAQAHPADSTAYHAIGLVPLACAVLAVLAAAHFLRHP